MAEHLKRSEAELNELLMEYWKLRHETGNNYSLLSFITQQFP
jgi:kinetochore protein Nuf2